MQSQGFERHHRNRMVPAPPFHLHPKLNQVASLSPLEQFPLPKPNTTRKTPLRIPAAVMSQLATIPTTLNHASATLQPTNPPLHSRPILHSIPHNTSTLFQQTTHRTLMILTCQNSPCTKPILQFSIAMSLATFLRQRYHYT